MAQKTPWYGKTWVVVLFLLFFWPVGLVFMWLKSCRWHVAAKVIVTCVLAAAVASSAFLGYLTVNTVMDDLSASRTSTMQGRPSPEAQAPSPSSSSEASSDSYDSYWEKLEHPSYNMRLLLGFVPSAAYLTEHEGEDVQDLLNGLGYTWSKDAGGYTVEEGGDVVVVSALGKGDAKLSRDELAALGALSESSTPVAYEVKVTPGTYDEVSAIMMEGSDIDESAVNEESGIAMFLLDTYGESDAIAYIITDAQSDTVSVSVYNDAYVVNGYLPDSIDGGRTGMDAEQLFGFFTQVVKDNPDWQVSD